MKNKGCSMFIIGLLCAFQAHAKPEIAVIVTLQEVTFRQKYPNKIFAIESQLSQRFADLLNTEIPLFVFKASGASATKLHIGLVKVGGALLYDANFRLQLTGSGFAGGTPKDVFLELAKNVQHSTILYKDNYEDFIEVVAGIFREQFKTRTQDIIDNQIGYIVISDKIVGPNLPKKEWTLSYTHSQLGIYEPTEFKVRQVRAADSTLQIFNGLVRSFFPTAKIKLIAVKGADDISNLNSRVLYVEGIQLIKVSRTMRNSEITSSMDH
jgi:hypothetical protein